MENAISNREKWTMISEEDVERFQQLYKERFGMEISKEDAYQKGVRLVRLMQIILESMSEKPYQSMENKFGNQL